MAQGRKAARMMRGAALAGGMALLTPAAAVAECGQAIGLLEEQIALVAEAAPLAADPEASLGPGDTLLTLPKPHLTARTRAAFDMLAATGAADGKGEAVARELAAARAALSQAQAARNRRDEAACQQAVSDGFAAIRQARGAFR